MTDRVPGHHPGHEGEPPRITVESAGLAVVQDLGRPGHGEQGISINGASDRGSARLANVLVGNDAGAPLLETAGSGTTLRFNADTLVAITGASAQPTVAGRAVPTYDPFVVEAGVTLELPTPERGWRNEFSSRRT